MTEPLPAELTSFVGRDDLVAELQRLLAERPPPARLLTLTGPGGSGKTRLALRVAHAAQEWFSDGVYFVALAAIGDPRLVATTVGQSMGVLESGGRPPLESVKSFIGDRRALLVLDNFEQLLPAAPVVPELLSACPRLQVLVTSRAALRVTGEREVAVAPLNPSDAQHLFVARARDIRASFRLTERGAAAVADICQRLDGLPLAIELAAARTRLLDPEAVLARLAHRLEFLTGGAFDAPARHQTLRNTIAWSYDLLTPDEQALFRTIGVFVGGCTLDAARAVAPRELEVLEVADALASKSLLQSVPAAPGEVRVGLLETAREFALEQAAWRGELDAVRRRHCEYVVALAETAEPALWGPAAGTWLERLERELDNIRAALEWALPGQGQLALRLLGALGRFYWTRSHSSEALQWYARAFDAAPQATPARMKALYSAAWLAHFEWDSDSARAYLDESLRIARAGDHQWAIGWVLHVLGRVAYFEGDHRTAAVLGEQALHIAEALNDDALRGWALHLLGLAAHIAGDWRGADALYARSLAVRLSLGHTEAIGILHQLTGISAFRQGDFGRARQLYRDYLAIGRELGSSFHLSNVLAQLASLAAAQQQPLRAARLFGATAMTSETSRTRTIPLADALVQEGMIRARRALGDTAFEAAFARGRMLTSDQAVAEALTVDVGDGVQRAPGSTRRLTAREREVAECIARGLTNRQIAAELVVTERTVAAHVEHILDKLDFTSRAQIAAWSVQIGSSADARSVQPH